MSDKNANPENTYLRIKISARPEILPCFYFIFQSGFLFHCLVGKSIEDLLLRQLALDRKFIEEKVNTVFLDGKAVDDISSAILQDGSVAAFSSALPGLAGATLRRGGVYASLRDSITYRKNGRSDTQREGMITVKLFNLLMGDLGSVLLEKGAVLNRSVALDLFNIDNEGFWRHVDVVEICGLTSSRERLFSEVKLADFNQIMVSVVINKNYTAGIVVPKKIL